MTAADSGPGINNGNVAVAVRTQKAAHPRVTVKETQAIMQPRVRIQLYMR